MKTKRLRKKINVLRPLQERL